jgi:hypothetical protein
MEDGREVVDNGEVAGRAKEIIQHAELLPRRVTT